VRTYIYSCARRKRRLGKQIERATSQRERERERERERGKLERPRVMVSKEQNKRGALHEKLKILRSVTHSHAVTVVISFSLSHVVHSSS
jgi:hypothetical protein